MWSPLLGHIPQLSGLKADGILTVRDVVGPQQGPSGEERVQGQTRGRTLLRCADISQEASTCQVRGYRHT